MTIQWAICKGGGVRIRYPNVTISKSSGIAHNKAAMNMVGMDRRRAAWGFDKESNKLIFIYFKESSPKFQGTYSLSPNKEKSSWRMGCQNDAIFEEVLKVLEKLNTPLPAYFPLEVGEEDIVDEENGLSVQAGKYHFVKLK